jgi:hypothetical protein
MFKKLSKIFIWPLGIALAIGLYFSENIRGYYRFKEICAKEGGLKVYQPLEKGVGWQIPNSCKECKEKYVDGFPGALSEVKFIRLNQRDTLELVDRYKDTTKPKNTYDPYKEAVADMSDPVRYELREKRTNVWNEIRLSVDQFEVVDLRVNQVVVAYKDYSYRNFSYDWGVGGGGCARALGKEHQTAYEILPLAFKK